MMTTIQINHRNNIAEMTKKFCKESCKYGADEYGTLQEICRNDPGYMLVVVKNSDIW